jgi:Sulfotransferase family
LFAQINKSYIKTRPSKLYSRLLSYILFEGRPITTKGQWINPLVFALFSVEKRLPELRKVKKPIFIIGTGRSGTTILGIVLSMHRDIGFLNEPKALWHSAYPEEDLIGSYSMGNARYRLGAKEVSPKVRTAMHRLYSSYLFLTGSQRVVDKYPELIFRVPFVLEIFPDAKFLFLARNGWDTCHSINYWSQRFGEQKHAETHNWWGVNNRKWKSLVEQLLSSDKMLAPHADEIGKFSRHTDMAAVEWIFSMREGLVLQQKYPQSVHKILYENFVNNPTETLEELLTFCELKKDSVFIEYAVNTLRPVNKKDTYELAPVIRPAFNNTMERLGYTI